MNRRFDSNDPVVRKAVEISLSKGKFSTAMLQTYLGKSHSFVFGLAIWFEEIGVIGPINGNKPRDMLIRSMEEFDFLANSGGAINQIGVENNKGPVVENERISEALKNKSSDTDFRKRTIVWIIGIVFCVLGSFMMPLFYLPCVAGAIIGLVYNIQKKKRIDEYFLSDEFGAIKNEIIKNTRDINDLNAHIVELKRPHIGEKHVSRGESELVSGGYNFRRPGWNELNGSSNTHYCSLQVVKNSKEQPFKYVCKYFDIQADEENLRRFEAMLNDFAAAEQGQVLLLRERSRIFARIDKRIPDYIIKDVPNRLVSELGFERPDVHGISFPVYNFSYISAGGNSTAKNVVVMNMARLEEFVEYLGSKIKWKKSIAGQRALMTVGLREHIKERDKYTCRRCGASVKKEPNLLLEIDHIIPLSKGGESVEENLQTLCWRCNRHKGARLE